MQTIFCLHFMSYFKIKHFRVSVTTSRACVSTSTGFFKTNDWKIKNRYFVLISCWVGVEFRDEVWWAPCSCWNGKQNLNQTWIDRSSTVVDFLFELFFQVHLISYRRYCPFKLHFLRRSYRFRRSLDSEVLQVASSLHLIDSSVAFASRPFESFMRNSEIMQIRKC